MAGVHGNRTHQPDVVRSRTVLKTVRPPGSIHSPRRHASTRPACLFRENFTDRSTASPGMSERYSATRVGGTATSNPPDVCGSTRMRPLQLRRRAGKSTRDSRNASRFRSAPPVLVPRPQARFDSPESVGTRRGSKTQRDAARRGDVRCVSEETEAGHVAVAQRAPTVTKRRGSRLALSLHIEAYSADASSVPRLPCFIAVARRRAERLREDESIADFRIRVAQNALRVEHVP